MTRKKFKRSSCGSSRGSYVYKSHIAYLKEQHEKNKDFVLTINVRIPEKYFVRCFGKLIQITEREAMMLGKTNIIIR